MWLSLSHIFLQTELASQVRKLEQVIDDLERKYRQLMASYEQAEELNQIECERNALLGVLDFEIVSLIALYLGNDFGKRT